MSARFTDKGIAALKPKTQRYEVWEGGSGFGIRVSPKGRKSWVWMYRFGGKARRMQFGTYPALSLASARVDLAHAKKLLDHGEDPGAASLDQKRNEREATTVKQLVDEYLERSAKGIRSYLEVKRILEKDVAAAWGRHKANSIKRRDVILLLDSIVDRGAPVMANRTLTWVRRMFNFAIEREIVESNPTAGVKAPSAETERERVLSDGEIRRLWNGLPDANVTDSLRLATKLILVTAQRPGEVAGAAEGEFDMDRHLWLIPAERSKNKRPQMVPLSPLAITIIEDAMKTSKINGLLFPSPAGDKPLTSRSISKAFLVNAKTLGIPFPDPKVLEVGGRTKLTADEETQVKMTARRDRKCVAFTPHDLRRTAATRMTEIGFPRFIVDRVLNHTEQGVGRVYDRYAYLKEKRSTLEGWGRRLEEILAGKESNDANVVPLRSA